MRLPDSLLSAAEPDPPQPSGGPHSPLVEIVIPVRNEDRDLAPCIRRLRTYLCEELPFTARITIADNGSTDDTWAQALALAGELPLVHAVRLERPGRGGALCSIWSASDADVYAYFSGQEETAAAELVQPPMGTICRGWPRSKTGTTPTTCSG